MTINSIPLPAETIAQRKELRTKRLSETAEQRARILKAERNAERRRNTFQVLVRRQSAKPPGEE